MWGNTTWLRCNFFQQSCRKFGLGFSLISIFVSAGSCSEKLNRSWTEKYEIGSKLGVSEKGIGLSSATFFGHCSVSVSVQHLSRASQRFTSRDVIVVTSCLTPATVRGKIEAINQWLCHLDFCPC